MYGKANNNTLFKQINTLSDLEELGDFIEKPGQNCTDEELTNGIDKVIRALENPQTVMNAISQHPFIPATFLFGDLVMKMNKKKCVEQLEPLFTQCFAELMEHCIYNVFDLKRFTEAAPDHLDSTLKALLANEYQLKRLFENSGNPDVLLEEIGKNYPDYQDGFFEYYNYHFHKAASLDK